jgi:hypothetical protein
MKNVKTLRREHRTEVSRAALAAQRSRSSSRAASAALRTVLQPDCARGRQRTNAHQTVSRAGVDPLDAANRGAAFTCAVQMPSVQLLRPAIHVTATDKPRNTSTSSSKYLAKQHGCWLSAHISLQSSPLPVCAAYVTCVHEAGADAAAGSMQVPEPKAPRRRS